MEPITNFTRLYLSSFLVILVMSSCGQEDRDRQLKADITIKAKNDVNFAGLQFFVDKGIVTIKGSCPTEKSLATVRQTLETIHIIDSVSYQISVAPVQLGPLFSYKQSVDSVLAKYPMVSSQVSDSSLIVSGVVKEKEADKLKDAIDKINPGIAVYQLQQL